MKERLPYVLILLILVLIPFSYAEAEITGKVITGKATQATTNVSISIIRGRPMLLGVLKPMNGTYLSNSSVPFVLDTLDADEVWYNLDNGENISINSTDARIPCPEGAHILYVFIKNPFGSDHNQSDPFQVNSSILEIVYGEYQGANKGNSTPFYDYTFDQLQNLSNVTFEDVRYGKITFNEPVNVSNDVNTSDNGVVFDGNVKILSKSISIDLGDLPNLNVSATIRFYNVAFVNPVLLRDGVECPATACANINYWNGVIRFDTNNLDGEYSIIDLSPPTTTTVSGGGGGRPTTQIIYRVPEENLSQMISPAPSPIFGPGEECTENWECTEWSDCFAIGRIRQCSDFNGCGTMKNKPNERESCIISKKAIPEGLLFSVIAVLAIALIAVPVGFWLAGLRRANAISELEMLLGKMEQSMNSGSNSRAFKEYAEFTERFGKSSENIDKENRERFYRRAMKVYNKLAR